MSRFVVTEENCGARRLIVLRDDKSGACAHLWPDYGNNCVALALPGPHGGLIPLVDDLSFLDELSSFPSRYGTPILYPWPGALPLGQYLFDGKRHQSRYLDINNNSYHGFVKDRAWRVESLETSDNFAELRCSISSDDHQDTLQSFPFPNVLTVTHRLDLTAFTLIAEVYNSGETPMPFGIGFHPYFKIPFAPDGKRGECLVQIDAKSQWDFEAIREVTVGPSAKVSPILDLRAHPHKPIPLGDASFNEGFTDLEMQNGHIQARVTDPGAQLTAVVQASDDFRTLVFYTPQTRSAVCLEPWTCTSNAFNLAAQGFDNSGLLVLGPQERWQGQMRLYLAAE